MPRNAAVSVTGISHAKSSPVRAGLRLSCAPARISRTRSIQMITRVTGWTMPAWARSPAALVRSAPSPAMVAMETPPSRGPFSRTLFLRGSGRDEESNHGYQWVRPHVSRHQLNKSMSPYAVLRIDRQPAAGVYFYIRESQLRTIERPLRIRVRTSFDLFFPACGVRSLGPPRLARMAVHTRE